MVGKLAKRPKIKILGHNIKCDYEAPFPYKGKRRFFGRDPGDFPENGGFSVVPRG